MNPIQNLEELYASNEAVIRQLQTSNDRLRDQIDVLRAAAGRPPMGTLRFLELPLELRRYIYKLNMGSGKVFFPSALQDDTRYHDRDDHEQPNWQLLQANQQVRDEAAETLFFENIIFISMDFEERILSSWGAIANDTPEHYLNRLLPTYLRRISIPFDFRDGRFGPLHFLRTMSYHLPSGRKRRNLFATDDGKSYAYHGAGLEQYAWHWADVLNLMTEYCNQLRWLQIDLTYCNCHQGCHRLVKYAVGKAIDDATFDSPRLETIEILGTQHRAERDLITSRLARKLSQQNFFQRQDGLFAGARREMKLSYKRFDLKKHISTTTHGFTVGTVEDMADEELDMQNEVSRYRERLWQKMVNCSLLRLIEHQCLSDKPDHGPGRYEIYCAPHDFW